MLIAALVHINMPFAMKPSYYKRDLYTLIIQSGLLIKCNTKPKLNIWFHVACKRLLHSLGNGVVLMKFILVNCLKCVPYDLIILHHIQRINGVKARENTLKFDNFDTMKPFQLILDCDIISGISLNMDIQFQ